MARWRKILMRIKERVSRLERSNAYNLILRLQKHDVPVSKEKRDDVLRNRERVENLVREAETQGVKLGSMKIFFDNNEEFVDHVIRGSDVLFDLLKKLSNIQVRFEVPPWKHYMDNDSIPEKLRAEGKDIIRKKGLDAEDVERAYREVLERVATQLVKEGRLDPKNANIDLERLKEFLENMDEGSARRIFLNREDVTVEELLDHLKLGTLKNYLEEHDLRKRMPVFRDMDGNLVVSNRLQADLDHVRALLRKDAVVGVPSGPIVFTNEEEKKVKEAVSKIRETLRVWEEAHKHIVPAKLHFG